jgi:stage IV sporulation protein FB
MGDCVSILQVVKLPLSLVCPDRGIGRVGSVAFAGFCCRFRMNSRQSPLYLSFSLGAWFSTQVRISVFFPVLIVLLGLKFGLHLGLVFGGLLFVTVLLHEFGHVTAARLTGGSADEILIWPLGGLAFVQPAGTFGSRFLTSAAGPMVNLMLCIVTFPAVYWSDHTADAINPFVMPAVEFGSETVSSLFVLLFAASWLQLLVNLIPVYPLDGGRMLQSCLALRWDSQTTTTIYIYVGFACAFVMMIVGLVSEAAIWLVIVGALVLVLNMQEYQQMNTGEAYDESFMGYDFSQGYTSLERSDPAARSHEPRPSFFQRWKAKRRAEKLKRQQQKELDAERQLDAILEKLHLHGFDSLTEAEKRELNRASTRYREREKPPE